jgi:hypothetical protein
MMNKITIALLSVALLAAVYALAGCKCTPPGPPLSCDQMGETMAEGDIRHHRVMRLNQQSLMGDIDRALLIDKPSKLTDKRIP